MNLSEKHMQMVQKYGAHNYEPYPVVLSRGEGVWVWDVEGNRYMDMLSAYSAVSQGHCHPKIYQAMVEQAKKLTLTSRAFHNDQLGPFLKKICEITGKDKGLPMNSGAEAVETALKAARKWGYTVKGVEEDKAEIITCANNFAGRTITVISFSTEKQYRFGFGPFTPGFKTIPYGDVGVLRDAITENTVAFLVEPIQGEGGIIVPPEGYLKSCWEICKENNVLLIADEVQTGLGRTGKMLACQHEEVNPDILTLGKALSGGFYPVSIMLADDPVMEVFNPGDHGSTFGGNPLAAAIASAALDVLVEENLAENAAILGDYFITRLKEIRSPYIKEVRGKGLLIGVEVKESSGGALPFCLSLLKEGILSKDTHHTVVRFAPPLTITKGEIDWAVERIQKVFTA